MRITEPPPAPPALRTMRPPHRRPRAAPPCQTRGQHTTPTTRRPQAARAAATAAEDGASRDPARGPAGPGPGTFTRTALCAQSTVCRTWRGEVFAPPAQFETRSTPVRVHRPQKTDRSTVVASASRPETNPPAKTLRALTQYARQPCPATLLYAAEGREGKRSFPEADLAD